MIESLHFHRGYALRLRKSKSLISYGIISGKMPPHHNAINAFAEEDTHGAHVFPL